jgi:hypothetical protein
LATNNKLKEEIGENRLMQLKSNEMRIWLATSHVSEWHENKVPITSK